ncbi:helix-turn-helix domain-containing protein [Pasteurellaceae bacterium TAE3-ERU1]|nr:helix-turn-helix domain-containing protein [Pasteurellaceae bacterium TAE3-ERU1]
MTKPTHKQQVLDALKNGEMVTPLEALRRFGCFRLGAVIYKLRQEGYTIKTHNVRKDGKYFADYTLEAMK